MCSNNLKLPIRAAPYRHQREAAAFALDKLVNGGGAALLMEMGTGKTLTTIAIVGRLWQEKRVQRLLVVAPLSILGVWEDEFRKFADTYSRLVTSDATRGIVVDMRKNAPVGWENYTPITSENPVISVADGVIFSKDGTQLIVCPCNKVGAYEIPQGVLEIGTHAFENCIYTLDFDSLSVPWIEVPAPRAPSCGAVGWSVYWNFHCPPRL